MSVVTRQTRRRWASVAAGVGLLVAVPALTGAAANLTGRASPPPPEVLVRRALASADVPHSGVAQSRGILGLPDLPRLGDVAALLGGTTTTREWWSSPGSWRVDVLTSTGEQDSYGIGTDLISWDYESSALQLTRGTPSARLPRADDLLPPQATRRLLAALGPTDRVSALPGRRVAGIQAAGLQVVPGDARSLLRRAEIWLDPGNGLPVELDLIGRDSSTVLTSRYLQVSLRRPPPRVLVPPDPPGASHQFLIAPDIVAAVNRYLPLQLPAALAGLPSASSRVAGTAAYGQGLVRFVVLPLPRRLAGEALEAALRGGAATLHIQGGSAALITSSLLDAVVATDDGSGIGYLVAGPVTPALLEQAAAQLLANPPPGL